MPTATENSSPQRAEAVDRDQKERARRLGKELQGDLVAGRGGPPKQDVAKPTPKPQTRPDRRPTVNTGQAEKHEYTGFVDDAAINVSMTVNHGKVEGDLYFLRAPERLYTLTGENDREGHLKLALINESVPVATVEISKDNKLMSAVQWNGTFHDSDGNSYDFFLGRSLIAEKPSLPLPQTIEAFNALTGFEFYKGTVTDRKGSIAEAFFKLKFIGAQCHGFYYQRYGEGQTSKILELNGANPRGVLTLRESDNDPGVAAEFHLKKVPLELTGNEVVWRGRLRNIRDNEDVKEVVFSRPRKP
jgi:hypothetical protein